MLFYIPGTKNDTRSNKNNFGTLYPAKPFDPNLNERSQNSIPVEKKGNTPFGQSFSYTDPPPKEYKRNNQAGKIFYLYKDLNELVD